MIDVNELISSIGAGFDTTFEMNEFEQPRIRSEVETVTNVILFILFTKPGQYPSLPLLGLDIQSKLYSYFDEIDVNELKRDLCNQCKALDVYLNDNWITIKKRIYRDQPSLLIAIQGTETYPNGYMKDSIDIADRYLIGISFDEMKRMVYDVAKQKGAA